MFSHTSCTEIILRQNSEITGLANQLTEENNILRNIVMQLEEKIKFYQQKSTDGNLERIYGEYLQAECFRKDLVFQKKYMLLHLRRFQECKMRLWGSLQDSQASTILKQAPAAQRGWPGSVKPSERLSPLQE